MCLLEGPAPGAERRAGHGSSPQSLGSSRTVGFPSGSAGKESSCSAGDVGHFTSRLTSAGEQKELGSLNKERRTSELKLDDMRVKQLGSLEARKPDYK